MTMNYSTGLIKALIVLIMLYGIVMTIQSTTWEINEFAIDKTPENFGFTLFNESLVAFEVTSAVLTAALVGALFLAMREKEVMSR